MRSSATLPRSHFTIREARRGDGLPEGFERPRRRVRTKSWRAYESCPLERNPLVRIGENLKPAGKGQTLHRHGFRTYTAPGWFPPQRVQ